MSDTVRDKAFARRLHQAAEDRPDVPPFGLGRQSWIKERMDVSHEAVRKWLSGETRPRPAAMKKLAGLFGVDEAWLSLGVAPDVPQKEREARNAMADGAVNVFAGLVQMNGGHCAFPSENDERIGFVDLYTIVRGSQFSVHITMGVELSTGVLKFQIPKEYKQCVVMGAIHEPYSMHVRFLYMTQMLMDKHRIKRGNFFEITMHKVNDQYMTGGDTWQIVNRLVDGI